MTAAPEPPPAWQHDKPTVGRLLVGDVAAALGWRDDEHYQLAVQPPDQMLRPRILPVARIRTPGAMIALESPVVIDGQAGHVADRIYFAPNPIDPHYLDRRVTRKGRPNRFDITRFAAFMMDLDFKPGGVVDQAGAQDLIREFARVTNGWYPALLVHSGHGWQPTYRVAGGELGPGFTASDVSVLLARIHTLVAGLAVELGLGVDSVFEATRLQRMPGSINGKDIAHPVPVALLPPTRIDSHPGTPTAMDLESLRSLLDSENSDAHVPVTARHLARGKAPVFADAAVSAADGWAWAPDGTRCTYLESVLAGWAGDVPPARNPWLFSGAIRLACAHRLGCLTEQGWHDAVAVLIGRFRHLLTTTTASGGPRAENPDEVSGCFDRAAAYAAAKSHAELVAELGGHDPADPFMKASHLLPPDDGVDESPPASASLAPPAVDTAPIADLVTSLVADIASIAAPAPAPVPPAPVDPVILPDPKDAKNGGFGRIAAALADTRYRYVMPDGTPHRTLRYLVGDWWRWSPALGWFRISDNEGRPDVVIRDIVRKQHLEGAVFLRTVKGKTVHEPFKVDTGLVGEVVEALRAEIRRYDGEPKTSRWWMRSDPPVPVDDAILLANGILDARTRTLHPSDPDLFSTVPALPIRWPADGVTKPPIAWLQFLFTTFDGPGCTDQIRLLQEIIGYLISGATHTQKLFDFIGRRRAGKGTVLHVIGRLLGEAAKAAKVGTLAQDWQLWALMEASVAVIADARFPKNSGRRLTDFLETALNMAGEDPITVNRKYRTPWTGRMPCRLVIASNDGIEIPDSSGALVARTIAVHFPNTFLGREDMRLRAKLDAELPGILAWALDGLERLIANGWVFTATEQGDAVRGDMIDAAQPLREFIDDGLVLVPERMEDPADDIYAAYRWWAEAVGLGVLDKLSLRRQVVEQWGGEGVTLQTRPHKDPKVANPRVGIQGEPTQVRCWRCEVPKGYGISLTEQGRGWLKQRQEAEAARNRRSVW